jgi:hypothetical protein
MSRILILFSLLFTSLYCQEEEFPFIGVTVSTHDISIDTAKDDATNESFGIKYGRQTVDWRTMLAFSTNSNYRSFSLEIDKFLTDELFGTSKLRPYLGFSVGTINYESKLLGNADTNTTTSTEENNISTTNDVDSSGYYYGLNLGLTIYAADSLDADIGYYYYKIEDFENVENMQGVTFGLHYFY